MSTQSAADDKDNKEKEGKKDNPANDERLGNVSEVGSQAVWSLSSCKPGKYQTIEFIHSFCWCNKTKMIK